MENIEYLKGTNPNPVITDGIKEEAKKICSQEALPGISLFDLVEDDFSTKIFKEADASLGTLSFVKKVQTEERFNIFEVEKELTKKAKE